MAKLTQRLEQAARKGQSDKPSKGDGKVAFLALMDEISEAMDKGWNARQIWMQLSSEGAIHIQYVQFARYIERYIKQKDTQKPVETSTVVESPKKEEPVPEKSEPKKATAETGSFTYTSSIEDDDLI
ncbi:TraK family protein [Kistimonas asteriae]|uniref:TraK family protein n=1 Tax=Kistimonas asteriae TaxID=517724 RepID=UPI001BA473B7|nr:TraK family protein [Kistimonas asteriae]